MQYKIISLLNYSSRSGDFLYNILVTRRPLDVYCVLVSALEVAVINQNVCKFCESSRLTLYNHSVEALKHHRSELESCRLKALHEINERLPEKAAVNWSKFLFAAHCQVPYLPRCDEIR